MTSSDYWNQATAEAYDEDTAELSTPEALEPVLDMLERLAAGGRALELAIGTGRIAVPLAARGVPVTGIELSEPMVTQLRRKVDAHQVPVVVGDMATTRAEGAFSLVYLVYNTIANLRTQAEQVACFRNAADHLAPGGRFVIELGIPPLRRLPPGQLAAPFDVSDTHLGIDTYDLVTQQAPPTTTHGPQTDAFATAPPTSATCGPPSATSWPSSRACSSRAGPPSGPAHPSPRVARATSRSGASLDEAAPD